MIKSHGYAALKPKATLVPFDFERRDPGPEDVVIEITHCGICHSDIHYVDNDWGFSQYPLVPGHEIVGRVTRVGAEVSKFKSGDLAAIGCLVDSCRTCRSCTAGEEHLCAQRPTPTYCGIERGSGRPTYGGYSNNYVVDQRFAMRLAPSLDPAGAAPLLCAGITMYSPLRHWQVQPGQKVGIVGIGGLGHVGVKLARAMGAHVVAFTSSKAKVEDALRLGAHEVVLSSDAAQMQRHLFSFDLILDAVAAPHDLAPYLGLLGRDRTLVQVGMPSEPLSVPVIALTIGRKRLSSSMIGGMKETQEMLDFCARHNVTADIEPIAIQQVGDAYKRILRNDVKYRFVIDLASLRG